MKTITFTLVLLICAFKSYSQDYEKFRLDYTIYTVYDVSKEDWGDWVKGENTFVINVNGHGDVKHYTHSDTEILYKKISSVENKKTEKGDKYQEISVLDEVGNKFYFLVYEDPALGIVIINSDREQGIQFSNPKE